MIETLIFSILWSKLKLDLELGKLKIHKELYSIKPIFKRWTIYPVILMALFYCYLQITILQHNYYWLQYQYIIKDMILFSYILLAYDVLYRNERYKEVFIAYCCLIIGFLLNSIVMYFNSQKMPIFPSLSYATGYTQYDMIVNASKFSDFHILGDHTTKLIILSDIFDFGTSIWSIGDLLIRIFAFLIIYNSIKSIQRK